MNRLTKRLNGGKELCIDVCGEQCVDGYTWCPKCKPFSDVMKKLAEYEDLEEKLEKVYGECDGLLETTVNSLVRHEGAEIGTPAKARLLTDEDVDKWLAWKDAEEQGLLLRLPCGYNESLYWIFKGYVKEVWFKGIRCDKGYKPQIIARFIDGSTLEAKEKPIAKLENIGKTLFFTKEEAEQALAKMKEV